MRRGLWRRGPTLRHRGGLDHRGSRGTATADHDACKRLALYARRARRSGPGRRAIVSGWALMLVALIQWLAQDGGAFIEFPFITLTLCLPPRHALADPLL